MIVERNWTIVYKILCTYGEIKQIDYLNYLYFWLIFLINTSYSNQQYDISSLIYRWYCVQLILNKYYINKYLKT